MTELEIRTIDKLLRTTHEPLMNILLYAEVGLSKMKQSSIDAGDMYRAKHDNETIERLLMAQKELDPELTKVKEAKYPCDQPLTDGNINCPFKGHTVDDCIKHCGLEANTIQLNEEQEIKLRNAWEETKN